MYCLINEQECFIRYKLTRGNSRVFYTYKTRTASLLKGFKNEPFRKFICVKILKIDIVWAVKSRKKFFENGKRVGVLLFYPYELLMSFWNILWDIFLFCRNTESWYLTCTWPLFYLQVQDEAQRKHDEQVSELDEMVRRLKEQSGEILDDNFVSGKASLELPVLSSTPKHAKCTQTSRPSSPTLSPITDHPSATMQEGASNIDMMLFPCSKNHWHVKVAMGRKYSFSYLKELLK